MSSFALDQSNLHSPAIVSENNIFMISANKIEALLPQNNLPHQNNSLVSEQNMFSEWGIGQSQIVSPKGQVLAEIANNKEGFVFADIEGLSKCGLCNKLRPDNTLFHKQLRPELYQTLKSSVNQTGKQTLNGEQSNTTPLTANVAIFATNKPLRMFVITLRITSAILFS